MGLSWSQCKVESLIAGVHLCRSPSSFYSSSSLFKMFCCHNHFIMLLSEGVSPDFSPSPVPHRPWEYLFVRNQELIFLPLFVLYHYKEIASILHLQPAAAGACEEYYNLVFSCFVLGFYLSLIVTFATSGWFEMRDFTKGVYPIQPVTCFAKIKQIQTPGWANRCRDSQANSWRKQT